MSGLPIGFLVAAGGLTLVVLLLLTWPLLRRRRRPAASRADFALRVHRDQLAEIERDVERGVLAPAEAEAARLEVQRRILAAASSPGEPGQPSAAATPGVPGAPLVASHRRALATAIAVLLPVAAGILYASLGNPRVADQPLAQRRAAELAAAGTPDSTDPAAADARTQALEDGVRRLAGRLEKEPSDMQGWFMLGRGYLALGRNADAVQAFRRARALLPGDPDVEGAFAEALIAAASGHVTDEARGVLQGVLHADPTSPQARFLLALDLAQQGDLQGAAQGWADLIALAPPDAPWLPMVREYLQQAADALGIDPATVTPGPEARALAAAPTGAPTGAPVDAAGGGVATAEPPVAPGPSAADVKAAAQMSEGERAEMIRGMVDRLAARLQREPDDADGWRRLAQAYRVLGEADKARDAQARADALAPR